MPDPAALRTVAATSLSKSSKKPIDIAGAGLVGLSIALELQQRGFEVTVWEAGRALQQASVAAAGMLVAEDPHHSPQLLPLARFSLALFPAFLNCLEKLSGIKVQAQTRVTVQHFADGRTERLEEDSLDPRELAEATLAAVRGCGIALREDCGLVLPERSSERTLIIAAGAWSGRLPLALSVRPRKGQMLRVRLPAGLRDLAEVHRSDAVYVVPRTYGPQAGTALIGATLEDAGFDTATHSEDLARLRALAAELLPALALEEDAPIVESWAGLRPATPDGLPLLGYSGAALVATGHYRNGILLAPATAVIIADLIEGLKPAVDIAPFAPDRFAV